MLRSANMRVSRRSSASGAFRRLAPETSLPPCFDVRA